MINTLEDCGRIVIETSPNNTNSEVVIIQFCIYNVLPISNMPIKDAILIRLMLFLDGDANVVIRQFVEGHSFPYRSSRFINITAN